HEAAALSIGDRRLDPRDAKAIRIPDPVFIATPAGGQSRATVRAVSPSANGSFFTVGDYSEGAVTFQHRRKPQPIATNDFESDLSRGFIAFSSNASVPSWTQEVSISPDGPVRLTDVVSYDDSDAIIVGTYRGGPLELAAGKTTLRAAAKDELQSLLVARLDSEGSYQWVFSLPLVPANAKKLLHTSAPVKVADGRDGSVLIVGSFAGQIKVANTTMTSPKNTLTAFALRLNSTTGTVLAATSDLFERSDATEKETHDVPIIQHVSGVTLDACASNASPSFVVSGVSFKFSLDPSPAAVDMEAHLIRVVTDSVPSDTNHAAAALRRRAEDPTVGEKAVEDGDDYLDEAALLDAYDSAADAEDDVGNEDAAVAKVAADKVSNGKDIKKSTEDDTVADKKKKPNPDSEKAAAKSSISSTSPSASSSTSTTSVSASSTSTSSSNSSSSSSASTSSGAKKKEEVVDATKMKKVDGEAANKDDTVDASEAALAIPPKDNKGGAKEFDPYDDDDVDDSSFSAMDEANADKENGSSESAGKASNASKSPSSKPGDDASNPPVGKDKLKNEKEDKKNNKG
ncbi:hypothetical protein HK405_013486, partial [Cladochytrium tenue]